MADVTEIVKTYCAAWSETDMEARAALLETAWADDGVYEDPMGRADGRTALIKHIGAVQSQFPGAVIEPTSGVDHHNSVLRFNWHMRMPDGSVGVAGVDFGTLAEDGRLQSITGFFGPVPEKNE